MTDYTLKEKANALVEATESYTRLKDERDELLVMLKEVVNNWDRMSEEKARELIKRVEK